MGKQIKTLEKINEKLEFGFNFSLEQRLILKQEIIKLIKEKYNPDKTTIELTDLFNFFSITDDDLIRE